MLCDVQLLRPRLGCECGLIPSAGDGELGVASEHCNNGQGRAGGIGGPGGGQRCGYGQGRAGGIGGAHGIGLCNQDALVPGVHGL